MRRRRRRRAGRTALQRRAFLLYTQVTADVSCIVLCIELERLRCRAGLLSRFNTCASVSRCLLQQQPAAGSRTQQHNITHQHTAQRTHQHNIHCCRLCGAFTRRHSGCAEARLTIAFTPLGVLRHRARCSMLKIASIQLCCTLGCSSVHSCLISHPTLLDTAHCTR